ncbi:transporter [Lithospermum erythrorhizon]|uniref:Transporter n=1 Tax=Lithospermum erythrorhizon TaxID=34254 RepID=A0AAV3RZJ6_LITER
MMSPNQNSEDRGGSSNSTTLRYLNHTGASVLLFIFTCIVPSSFFFLILQKPWKGRPLTNAQVVPAVINGGITALYFILWGKGLKSCGPVRSILAEYAGAVLGVLSAVLYGRRGHLWKKIGGLIAMLASFYFLSQGWATATSSPFNILFLFLALSLTSLPDPIMDVAVYELNQLLPFSKKSDAEIQTEQDVGMKEMLVPIVAGILSALRRVISRRVSLKSQLKRRLNAITIASATCFLFPVAIWDMIIGSKNVELPFSMWTFSSTIFFGIILIFYVDSIAEERLHMVFSSPRHLMVAGVCIILMEIVYKMDFSLPGFFVCAAILGFGIYEATSLDRVRKDSFMKSDGLDGILDDGVLMSSLPT